MNHHESHRHNNTRGVVAGAALLAVTGVTVLAPHSCAEKEDTGITDIDTARRDTGKKVRGLSIELPSESSESGDDTGEPVVELPRDEQSLASHNFIFEQIQNCVEADGRFICEHIRKSLQHSLYCFPLPDEETFTSGQFLPVYIHDETSFYDHGGAIKNSGTTMINHIKVDRGYNGEDFKYDQSVPDIAAAESTLTDVCHNARLLLQRPMEDALNTPLCLEDPAFCADNLRHQSHIAEVRLGEGPEAWRTASPAIKDFAAVYGFQPEQHDPLGGNAVTVTIPCSPDDYRPLRVAQVVNDHGDGEIEIGYYSDMYDINSCKPAQDFAAALDDMLASHSQVFTF